MIFILYGLLYYTISYWLKHEKFFFFARCLEFYHENPAFFQLLKNPLNF